MFGNEERVSNAGNGAGRDFKFGTDGMKLQVLEVQHCADLWLELRARWHMRELLGLLMLATPHCFLHATDPDG